MPDRNEVELIQASSTNGNWLSPTEWCGDCTT
jgi:hypothetical protein